MTNEEKLKKVELERLVEIGKATEKIFKQDFTVALIGYSYHDGTHKQEFEIETVQELLEWMEGY